MEKDELPFVESHDEPKGSHKVEDKAGAAAGAPAAGSAAASASVGGAAAGAAGSATAPAAAGGTATGAPSTATTSAAGNGAANVAGTAATSAAGATNAASAASTPNAASTASTANTANAANSASSAAKPVGEPHVYGSTRRISDDPNEPSTTYKNVHEDTQASTASGAAADAPKKAPKKEKKALSRGGALGFGALGTVVVLVIALVLWTCTPIFNFAKSSGSSSGTINIENSEDATLAEAVSAKCLNSVVTIYVYSNNSSWNQYFGGGSSSNSNSPTSLGSGVIIKVDGNNCYILTNYHVIEGASKMTVSASDETYSASVVGSDEQTDLAVIKITASGLKAIEWGDSSDLSVGEWVMAIGSPYGYEQTVTTGIVSALYRSDTISSSTSNSATVYTDMIQTDAAINPGNSGGALVDDEGELIGINTYISSSSQSSAGLGFAIPQAEAQAIAEKLMSGKKVSHAYLGVTALDSENPEGAAVETVYTGTPAQKAGFQQGDVITKVNDTDIDGSSDLTGAIIKLSAGDKANITYVRDGKEQTVEVTLAEREDDTSSNSNKNGNNGNGNNNGNDNGNSGNGGNNFDFDLEDLFNMFN